MADIFISYARASETRAIEVADALTVLGYSVWRDDDLPPHRDYSEVIEERLREAKAVAVLWSSEAVRSQWVRAEAEIAREAGTLVQINLDGSSLPLPFNRIQCADLTDWTGDLDTQVWRRIRSSLAELVADPSGPVKVLASPISPPHLPLPDKPSVAILPLANLSGDSSQEYFADAITEDLITALSHWRSFFVIARNSSFAYKGRPVDVRRVGSELGVRYVLEGSVRKVGQKVRVTAQLIDCPTGTHVWSQTLDRELDDILALQDEITAEVARAIYPAILQSEYQSASRKGEADVTALDCYYRGMWHLNRVTAASYAAAVSYFREAIQRDRDLPLGYIGLARILYGGATVYAWSEQPEADLKASLEAAETAMTLDPNDADAHFAAAGALLYLARHADALSAARRSVGLNPNSAYGQLRLAQVLVYSGRPTEAVGAILKCIRQSPFDPQMGASLGVLALAHYHSEDYAAAVEQARAAVANGFTAGHALIAAALARMGDLDGARRALPLDLLARAMRDAPRLATYARDADRDHFLGGLMMAGFGLATPNA